MAIPTAPENPQIIRSADRTSAFFAWNAVTAAPAVTEYRIYGARGLSVLGYVLMATIPNQGTPVQFTVIDGLEMDTVYSFHIIAYNGAESPASLEIQDF